MENFSQDQNMKETIKAAVQELHTVIGHKDAQRVGGLVSPDVFVLGAAADDFSISREQLVTQMHGQFEQVKGAEIRLHSPEINVGLCDSGRSAWFFDRFMVDIVQEQKTLFSYPIRLTGLMVLGQAWQLAAAFWSIPLRDNDYQYDLIVAGKLKAGKATGEGVSPKAQPLAQSIMNAMAQPLTMPDLYSTHMDAFTIGSTVEEVFRAVEGKNFVGEIVQMPLKFAVRGGIRGAVSPDGCTAWLATHIDLTGGITMPYRFFYIWLREKGEWKIVVSHDAVSIDPTNPDFESP